MNKVRQKQILYLLLIVTLYFIFSNWDYTPINNNRCPNLSHLDLIASKGILNSKIAIVLAVVKPGDYKEYTLAVDSVKCYAAVMGYQMHLINMTQDGEYQKTCNHTDIFFQRHCALATFMEAHKDSIDYVLFIDADIGVVNPCHRIQDYIDPDDKVEITFYERYYNFEIMAGTYLVRNTEKGRQFLKFWADYFYRLPHSFHGTDNGAIHQVFMEQHFTKPSQQMQCYHFWNSSHNFADLFAYQACTQFAFSNATLFANNTIKLIRKLSPSWGRDAWLTESKWGPQDFMFHGWKQSKLVFALPGGFLNFQVAPAGRWKWRRPFSQADFTQCEAGDREFSKFQYRSEFVASDTEIKSLLKDKVEAINLEYIQNLKNLKLICKKNNKAPINGKC